MSARAMSPTTPSNAPRQRFSERELAQVIAMAVTINAWNRINVTIRLQPPTR